MENSNKVGPGRRSALRALRIAGFAVLGVTGAALFALAFGYFVMLLWNWLMPSIFHLGEIGYWQAFGIVILAKLLFGAVGGGRHGASRAGRHSWRHWDPKGDRGPERGEPDSRGGLGSAPGDSGRAVRHARGRTSYSSRKRSDHARRAGCAD